jgi:hypothetical protein
VEKIKGLYAIEDEMQFWLIPQILHHLAEQVFLGPVVIDNENVEHVPLEEILDRARSFPSHLSSDLLRSILAIGMIPYRE